ncbi:hypothetical protein KKA47_00525, partial [bacterium]|nr:hypothetical protein [bacterium]
DIEKAKKLLDEAGWIDTDGDGIRDNGGKPFKFTFVTAGGSGTFFQLFTMMRENMLKVGIEMTIQQMEGAAYLSKINERNFDAMASGWSSNPNADPYQIWHSSQIEGGSNHVAFKNSEVDRLLVEARKEFNALKRKQMNQRAFRIIHDEQPYTFLFTPASLVAVDKRFKNVRVYKRGLRSIEWEL